MGMRSVSNLRYVLYMKKYGFDMGKKWGEYS